MLRILALLFFITIGSVFSGPDDFFSEENAKQLIKQTLEKFDSSGSVNKNIKETYYAVDVLKRLGSKPGNPSGTCQFAKDETGDNIENVFYSVSIRETLGCGEAVTGKTLNTITSALSSNNLLDLVHVVGAVSVLKANKHIDIASSKLTPVETAIIDLLDSESGTWFLDKNQEEGSPYYAGLALTALSQLASILGSEADIGQAVEAVLVLLDNGISDDDNRLFFRHTDNSINSLLTTAYVVKGLADISQTAEDVDVDEQVDLIASFLVSQKFVSSVEDSHALLVGLEAVNRPVFKRPIVLSLVNTQIFATKEKDRETNVLVKITDVFGAFTTPVKVILVRAFRSGKEEISLLSNQELALAPNEKTVFTLDFLAARPDPGTYSLEFRVVPQAKSELFQSVSSTTRRVQVVAAIGLSEGNIDVTDSTGKVASHSFQQDQTIKQEINAKNQHSLLITFKLKNLVNTRSVQVHQAFIKLTNRNTQKSKYFIVPQSGQGYELKLSGSKIGQAFNYANGTYDVEILIGDSFVSSSLRWIIAKVQFTFDGIPEASKTANIYDIRPEIKHIFRPAATLASAPISLLFTGAIFVPSAIFLLGALRIGGVFNTRPDANFIYVVLFLGGIGCIFGTIFLYWLNLKLFTALTYIGILSIPTIFFGKEVLKSIAQHRKKKQQ